ncbi:MAG: peptidase domain-containing ABC transporter [Hydrococcus sp. Prado102]|jgi:ATP-binding cassette subfamily B protein|nr:peptidase domain-containing ABC transporter [Hydrococcus sp. Prado102]
MVVSHQNLNTPLIQAFGEEFANYSQLLQTQEFPPGKPFWNAADAKPGIYLVLSGKVRLLDASDRPIVSLDAGKSFGEMTLFPEASCQPYSARASFKLKLGYLSGKDLETILRKHPTIRDRFYQRAIEQDLLVLCRQIDTLQEVSSEAILQMLPLLEKQTFPTGKLCLLRQGEAINSSGEKFIAGRFYPSQLLQNDPTNETELYCLSEENWQKALEYVPQLANLVEHNATSTINYPPAGSVTKEVIRSPEPLPSKEPPKAKIRKAYFPSPSIRVNHVWQRFTRRYPYFEQQSASDCGAASLVMVGRYWGKRFSVNRLRELANVDRSGASLRGLAEAAESIGFSTRPVKAGLKKLAEQNLPAIAHWEGKHYIVVYEITKDRVIVCDPAIGQRNLTHDEFKEGWTGYTLLLQPTALLQDAQEERQPFWQFFELVKPHGLVLFEVLISSILIQILGLVTPLFTQLLLDRVVVQRSNLTLTAIGIGMLLFGLFRVAIVGLRQYLLDHTAQKVDTALIIGFISHTFRLPLKYFESRYVGDIISRVQENRKIQRFLTGEALSIFLDLLTVFIYVGLMFWYSWQMALLTLVVVPPFAILTLVATPFLKRISREIFAAITVESSYLIQSLTGIRTVKSMSIEQSVRWHWEELLSKSVKTSFGGQVIGNRLQIFSGVIQTVVTTGLLWFGAWQVIQNQLTVGQLVAFNMLLGNVISPFQRLTVLWNDLQEVLIAVERINDVIDAEPEEDLHKQVRQSLPPVKGNIRFEQVTFRYNPDSDANTLENISFEVKPGEMVALVGRSGSGKTTISKLLLGLYTPTQGKILIDGYEVESLSLRSLRQQIGVVDQDTFMFGGTIRENISVGYPSASLDEVIVAAQLAGAHQFIQELPMGYETQMGEGGGLLSGGQRQRIAIARALLGNPRILILDEATSSLDAESERIIQNNLTTILRGRTTFVIAHRLSTVRNANKILVLDRGVLIESGSHEELMAKRGHYFYLNQQQLTSVG